MTLEPVTLKGTYFATAKGRFLPVGAHWVPAKAGLQWPYQWDAASIEADFVKMKDLGFNTVRFDLFWAWFEPRPGQYNEEAFNQMDYFIRLAHQYAIYLHPTLFVGGEVGEAFWDVPWRHGRHPHLDAEMLRLQTNHAAEMAWRYQKENAILAWDLTDEPPFWIVSDQTTDAMAVNWTRLLAGAIRKYDKQHPIVVGTSMEDVSHGPFRPDILADEVDFFSAHPYSIYALGLFPDPMLSLRGTYCGAFQTLLSKGAGHPVMIHELGASSAQYTPERVAAFDRTTIYSSLGAGAHGFLLWCYTDAAPEKFKEIPYLRAPHETQFGLTTWDRKDRPNGEELRKFSRIAAQMDLENVEPEPANAAIIVPDEWAKPHGDFSKLGLSGPSVVPYVSTQDGGAVLGQIGHQEDELNRWLVGSWLSTMILARQSGFNPSFPREYSDWQKIPTLLLPSPLTSTEHNLVHVHTSFWEKVKAYVKKGGGVYASLCTDAAIPEMGELFGARLADHTPVREVEIRMIEPFGDLKAEDRLPFSGVTDLPQHWPATLDVKSGRVIAVDQDGRPALVTNTYGKGKTLLSTYPIESYLATQPAAFEGSNSTYRLYRAFRQWIGITSPFETDQVVVEIASLNEPNRGYIVLTNHSPRSLEVKVTAHLPITSISLITPDGSRSMSLKGQQFRVIMDAFDGALLEWRHDMKGGKFQ